MLVSRTQFLTLRSVIVKVLFCFVIVSSSCLFLPVSLEGYILWLGLYLVTSIYIYLHENNPPNTKKCTRSSIWSVFSLKLARLEVDQRQAYLSRNVRNRTFGHAPNKDSDQTVHQSLCCPHARFFHPFITNTCLCNFDPLKPHFCIVKLGFQGYTLFFLFLLKNIDCGTR